MGRYLQHSRRERVVSMQADMMSMYIRTIEHEKDLEKRVRSMSKQRAQTQRMQPAAKLGNPIYIVQPVKPQAIQPIPVKPLDDSGRQLLELLWSRIDSNSLKAFQIGDKLSKSPYPAISTAGSLLALIAVYQGVKKLDEKLVS